MSGKDPGAPQSDRPDRRHKTRASIFHSRIPHEIRFDRDRNLYVVERDTHVVRKIDATTNVLEQADVALRRADEDGDLVERDAVTRFLHDPARDLDAFAPFAWRGEELERAVLVPYDGLDVRLEEEAPQIREVVVARVEHGRRRLSGLDVRRQLFLAGMGRRPARTGPAR